MALDIKICGLSTEETVEAALEGGATHAGFIFFEKSPRNVSLETAGRLARLAGGKAQTVVVTVDARDAVLDGITDAVKPDMIQCHGNETPERLSAIRSRYGLPVMKALSIREARDIERIAPYAAVADRLLFDAKAPAGSALPGGNGVAFDWSLLDGLDPDIEYMLSGGLNRYNIAVALARTAAGGIDVSSGVESAPGIKDVALIRAFLKTVRTLPGVGSPSKEHDLPRNSQ